jgi:hypothetical protein
LVPGKFLIQKDGVKLAVRVFTEGPGRGRLSRRRRPLVPFSAARWTGHLVHDHREQPNVTEPMGPGVLHLRSGPDVFAEIRRASRWYRSLGVAGSSLFVLGGVGFFIMWFSEGDGSNLVSGLILTPPMVWMTVRAARIGIVPDSDGIVVRGELRTRRVAWRDINRFSLEWTGHILPWHELKVALRDGSQFAFSPPRELRLRRGRCSRRLERIVTALNDRVQVEATTGVTGPKASGETMP